MPGFQELQTVINEHPRSTLLFDIGDCYISQNTIVIRTISNQKFFNKSAHSSTIPCPRPESQKSDPQTWSSMLYRSWSYDLRNAIGSLRFVPPRTCRVVHAH
ncbi:hypothetical protein E1B28_013515 [Marasmius oreades]|uniref:Uncharacterized protein n=1 Tax=Marasmius oreades TaxID=181124 RepID=A0A9P7UN34_9AGAR|nr:uncharacterized protein E1B28_013515 [Marasmius oreades]KAG7087560.1 hypothetical protein E1B28_013515 [Marasmius oreades]